MDTAMRRFYICLFFLCSSMVGFAQQAEEEEQGYVYEDYFTSKSGFFARLGLSQAGVTGWMSTQPTSRILSYSYALGYTHSLTYKGDVSLNVELGMSRQGFRVKSAQDPDDMQELTANYLNIPVFIKYYPMKNFRPVYIGMGPQFGYRTNSELQTKNGGQYLLLDKGFKDTDLSLIGVAGVHFAKKLDLGMEFRYQHSLNSFLDTPTTRHSIYQISVFFPAEAILELGAYFPIF